MYTIRRVSFAIALVAAMVAGGVGTRETRVRAEAVTAPFASSATGECALVCWISGCPSNYHFAITTGVPEVRNVEWGSGPHNDYNCYPGSCPDQHPWCEGMEGDELEELRLALVNEDVLAAATLIGLRQDHVAVNVARSAVPITSCQGDVVAHLPVSVAFGRRVQDVLESQSSGKSRP